MKKIKLININKPQKQIGELSEEQQVCLQMHFDSVMKRICFERYIFRLVLKGNKTLISLIAGALTGFSINILTGFLELDEYSFVEKINVFIILAFALILNIAVILFAARLAQVQEAGLNLIIMPNHKLRIDEIRIAQNNLIYLDCYENIGYLKRTFIISAISAVLTFVFLVCGKQIIAEVISWLTCLQQK